MTQGKTCLLLVDVQNGLFPTIHPTQADEVRKNIPSLLAAARRHGHLVIHIQHLSISPTSVLHPDAPGVSIHSCAQPLHDELLITKDANSAFIGTDLEQILRDAQLDILVIAGLVTEHCVSTTTRMASNLRLLNRNGETNDEVTQRILLVQDATGSQGSEKYGVSKEQMKWNALAELDGEFCRVIKTEEWLASL